MVVPQDRVIAEAGDEGGENPAKAGFLMWELKGSNPRPSALAGARF